MAADLTSMWTTFVQPCLTPLVAAFVAWRFGTIQAGIAKQQVATAISAAETARKKLKFDLFDRRLKIHEGIYAFLRELPSLPAIADFTPYFQDLQQVRWLFDKPVVDWVYNDLFQTAQRFQLAKVKVAALTKNGSTDIAAIVEVTNMQSLRSLRYDKLASHSDPYLRLEH